MASSSPQAQHIQAVCFSSVRLGSAIEPSAVPSQLRRSLTQFRQQVSLLRSDWITSHATGLNRHASFSAREAEAARGGDLLARARLRPCDVTDCLVWAEPPRPANVIRLLAAVSGPRK